MTIIPIENDLEQVYDVIDSYPIEHWDKSTINALSIGAPELLRYNLLSDFLETSALEILYVQYGKEKANFSIGQFQMKPSFIEQLEILIKCDAEISEFKAIAQYNSDTEEEIRSERLHRIKDWNYQIKYLKAFHFYASKHYQNHLQHLCEADQIAFIATAYNMGINTSAEDIINYQEKQNFPYGSDFQGKQYSYGELSATIFQHLISKSCLD